MFFGVPVEENLPHVGGGPAVGQEFVQGSCIVQLDRHPLADVLQVSADVEAVVGSVAHDGVQDRCRRPGVLVPQE